MAYDISVLEFIGVSITSVWYLDRELNKELKEYKVDYADEMSDYLSYNDFAGWRRSNFGAKLQAIKPSAIFVFARFCHLIKKEFVIGFLRLSLCLLC